MNATATSLPPNAPVTNGEADVSSLQNVCALLHAQVADFLAAPPPDEVTERTQEQTKIALEVIAKALQDYEFGSLSISYNGGKDCLVLLILYLAVLHTHFTQPKNRRKDEPEPPRSFPTYIPAIYAKPPDPFPAVTEFVEYSSRLYHLDLTHIATNPGPRPRERSHSNPPLTHGLPSLTDLDSINGDDGQDAASKPTISFRDAFALYLTSHPSIQAIFVGTRRTDPHGSHLTHFDPTDHNWPKFMRIHPIIDWRLSEIWCFLRSPHLKDPLTGGPLKYCSMYDEGYTSLGGVNDTLKNPKLKCVEENGDERYKPAYEMTQDDGERLGRE
ncbi:hypothetical protein A1O3_05305 [Capronia epimyces CBS 606.96]|uniref:FAD synthase n=1 Tax=Capronia epimyces CBS 606.96 TaxID=1182542 RepID=W9Y4R3_9EURO|nr:uncharacterized protein A1O3_05305 [Capronia epimyces CBS 606.96]EXJ84635.1 hypothetical protein A1O3_05305 [Capronia epimyces CBS 606.96]